MRDEKSVTNLRGAVTIRLPKYRHRPDRDSAFVEIFGRRIPLPGGINSPESLAAYHKAIAEYSAAKLVGTKTVAPKWELTVSELAVAYLDWAKIYHLRKDGQHGGEYQNSRDGLRELIRQHGDTLVSDFGPLALKNVRNAMIAANLSRSTVNDRVGRIKRLFRWGVENELVPPDIHAAIAAVVGIRKGKTSAKEPPPIAAVPPADVEAVLLYLTPVQADMVRVHRLTGMRSENLCLLRPADVDRSNEVWLYRPPQHKGSYIEKSLVIPLGPKCQAILQPYIDREPEEFCFSPRESEQQRRNAQRAARKTPMTPSQAARAARSRTASTKPKGRKGTHYTPGSYRRMIWYAIKRMNRELAKQGEPTIPPWHPHQIRHTVATEIRQKYQAEAARVFLGHARLSVTEIYAERDLELARRIAREMG